MALYTFIDEFPCSYFRIGTIKRFETFTQNYSQQDLSVYEKFQVEIRISGGAQLSIRNAISQQQYKGIHSSLGPT